MTRWQPYPEYKDSGVEWLGEIPTHWEMRRLKYAAPESSEKLEAKPEESLYLGLENIESGTGRLLLNDLTENVASTVVAFREDDVLFGKLRPYLAKVVHADFDGVGTTELLVLRPKDDVESRFLFYYLLSDGFIDTVNSLTYGAKMPRANSEQVGDLVISLPPLPEQRAIAAFLDRQTARLDALVTEQRRLSELLQERRAALINRAVTRGVPPGATHFGSASHLKVKNSGILWLGEIPEHWETKQVRYIAESLQTGPFGSQLHSSDYVTNGTPVVNPAHMKDGCIDPDWEVTVDEKTCKRLEHHKLRTGDIVLARRGELGRCALVTQREDGWLCGTGSLKMRPRSEVVHSPFLNRVFSTNGVGKWLTLESVGTTMDNLNASILSRLPLPVPPLPEQRAIATYLDRETAKIDAAVAEIETSVARLEEYRTALVSAAVTGKIDVRQDKTSKV